VVPVCKEGGERKAGRGTFRSSPWRCRRQTFRCDLAHCTPPLLRRAAAKLHSQEAQALLLRSKELPAGLKRAAHRQNPRGHLHGWPCYTVTWLRYPGRPRQQ